MKVYLVSLLALANLAVAEAPSENSDVRNRPLREGRFALQDRAAYQTLVEKRATAWRDILMGLKERELNATGPHKERVQRQTLAMESHLNAIEKNIPNLKGQDLKTFDREAQKIEKEFAALKNEYQTVLAE